ncbi:MAG: imidazole glycerol phosphate synthase subunit HisF [Chloroflexi bacterium]|jgi:imidazole glycerol-phosphate synthase subunit HisF|nr:imidazole glycerol phosphate synthase subunit HisF [Chloroflexota bacterium]MDA1281144.1 imidazole glycerol phosphate synthase subunit HisF [Chloroflexota bacterium]
MLTRRVIPCLDVDNGRVVKGVSFVDIRDAGDPAELAAFYNAEGADELVFLDITASSDARNTMIDVVEKVSSEVFIPLTVGGGIRSVDNMRQMLEAGADKVAVNSAAVANPQLIEDCAKEFGAQCVVLAMDVKRVDNPVISELEGYGSVPAEWMWQVYTHGGRRSTALDAVKWARLVTELGAGELLVTSMDADGQKTGYDNELLSVISDSVTVPVIASGGAGELDHFYDALVEGKSDAVLAASLFHFGELRVSEVKSYLAERGIPMREV